MILELCSRLSTQLEKHFEGRFMIVLINDGSTRETINALQEIENARNPRVVVLHNPENCGQADSTVRGLNELEADCYITMDDDLQHYPEDVLKLVQCFEKKGVDLVYGIGQVTDSFERRIGQIVFNKVLEVKLGEDLSAFHGGSSFRLISHRLRNKLLQRKQRSSMLDFDLINLCLSYEVVFVQSGKGLSRLSVMQLVYRVVKFLFEDNAISK
jgi:undecaprenyl-phosphate 4-deoxy-4-formamido-L-arabinose transferase